MKKLMITLLSSVLALSLSLPTVDAKEYYYDNNNRLVQVNHEGQSVRYFYNEQGSLENVKKDPNLVINEGFEVSTSNKTARNWSYWKPDNVKGEYVLDTTTPYAGSHAQRITAQSITNSGMNIYQDIKVAPGGTYHLSAQLQVLQVKDADVMISIHFFDNQYNLVGVSTPYITSTSVSWLGVNRTVPVPAQATIARIHFHAQSHANKPEGSADFLVDEIRFQKEKVDSLLFNESFERYTNQAVAEGWKSWKSNDVVGSYSLDTTSPYAGQRSQRITATSIPEGGMNIYQDIKVEPKETYYLSAQFQVSKIQNADAMVSIHYFDEKYNLVAAVAPYITSTPVDWLRVSRKLTVPDTAAVARIHIHTQKHMNKPEGSVDLLIDEIHLKKEPGSMMFNGNFERYNKQDVAAGWKYWKSDDVTGSYMVDKKNYYEGKRAQRVTAHSIPEGGMNVYQDIKVDPKAIYYLSAKMKVLKVQNADVVISIHYFDDKYNLLSSATAYRAATVSDWADIKKEIVVPDKATIARVHFHAMKQLNKPLGSADFLVDQVMLSADKPL
ncbi:carbohydrate binding domain-containing protein [Paenibacillus sp. SC116]|uniref:carbohydrate binding domain-containing protein n=1 Tax=Paenibacillus sp. SC116 TaxID=2968986 RepID=UPI00215A2461|nr:carbohydrate binding domain-containing protein [Paenibacillus sp. SC116]MCR8843749.1 carbohydrate binding domain-containing protein [Paenibacillus sp. SC116]